jgi:hypothetical protein
MDGLFEGRSGRHVSDDVAARGLLQLLLDDQMAALKRRDRLKGFQLDDVPSERVRQELRASGLYF